MRSKKALDQAVLEVLSGLKVDGSYVRIAVQLERKMYTRVNEVLEAIGGKWDRKGEGHLFSPDIGVQERLDEVLTTGELVREPCLGWFPTPAKLARELVALAEVQKGMCVLEPSAGKGTIVDALVGQGADVLAIEIDLDRAGACMNRYAGNGSVRVYCADFMRFPASLFNRVVMNPPFVKVGGADHLDHVMRAAERLEKGGILVSVLPASVSFRQDARHRAFRDWYKSFGGKLTDLPAGSFRESGTNVNTVVLRMCR